MSAEATFWAWMMGVKPAACKLVLLCLADCHNADNGRCDPGGGYIAEFTGLDKKTIPDCIQRLEMMGLITAKKRPGNSTQYHLHIEENPIPAREKGERKKAVPFGKVILPDPTRKRVHPKTGTPDIGCTRKRTPTIPENGEGVYPKTGNEPTKNLPVKPANSSARYRAASGAGIPVDNSMLAVGRDYRDQSAESLIFNRGVQFLTARGVAEKSARAFLGKCKADAGAGRTLDAVVTAILSQPEGDPKAYILGVLANPDRPMETTWEPDDATVAELQALEIPTNLIRQARDTFVTWFHHMEIYHSNWPQLFKRWVIRDWEAAEFDAFRFKRRLAQSSGFAQPAVFREPA